MPLLDDYKGGKNIIDVGTGAGFPAIPLKIVREDRNFTLLDSVGKKVGFLKHCIEILSLDNVRAYHDRAEEFAGKSEHREKYDIVLARAVASLPVLLEYCLPFLKDGGIFLAMKGRTIDEEIKDSVKALKILKSRIACVKTIQLPLSDITRNIIVIVKDGKIDGKYPRKSGKPAKEPLI